MSRYQIHTKERRAIVNEVVIANPGIETWKLARLLYAKHRPLFMTLDSARSAVRLARGSMGNQNRKNCKVVGKTPVESEIMRLPRPKLIPSEPFKIQPGRTLILCDVHIPFHDRRAVEAAIKFAKGKTIDAVLLGGDMGDFFSISRFLTDPTERDLPGELKMQAEFLKYLRQNFPKAQIVWKLGNHEERWAHYLWTKAPELYGLPCLRLGDITGADKLGIPIVDDRLPVQIGGMNLFHGHELAQGAASPVNPARGLFIRLVSTSAIGHLHRTSEHAEKIGFGGGRFITCWSIGCLCNLSPMYARVNKWNHGFAVVESKADSSFNFHNKRLHEGRVL